MVRACGNHPRRDVSNGSAESAGMERSPCLVWDKAANLELCHVHIWSRGFGFGGADRGRNYSDGRVPAGTSRTETAAHSACGVLDSILTGGRHVCASPEVLEV